MLPKAPAIWRYQVANILRKADLVVVLNMYLSVFGACVASV